MIVLSHISTSQCSETITINPIIDLISQPYYAHLTALIQHFALVNYPDFYPEAVRQCYTQWNHAISNVLMFECKYITTNKYYFVGYMEPGKSVFI